MHNVRHKKTKLHQSVDASSPRIIYCAFDLLSRYFVDSVQLADSTSTTHLYHDYYNAVQDRRGWTTQAGAADVPAPLHRLMDRRGHG